MAVMGDAGSADSTSGRTLDPHRYPTGMGRVGAIRTIGVGGVAA